MRALASFILRGYSQTIMVMVGMAVLAMIAPPFSLVSGAALALATLRNGARFGLLVMVVSTVFVSALAYFSLGDALIGLILLAILWLPLWVVAWVLREFRSLALASIVTAALGVAGILLVYLWLGDTAAWWQEQLLVIFEPAIEAGGGLANREAVESILAGIARIMTGIAAAGIVLNTLMCLYLGRGWQAMLYNPGGFRSEFYELRLGRWIALASLLVIVVSMLPLGVVSHLADEILIVVFVLFVIQGLAMLHAIVAKRKMHPGWLFGLYVLAFLVLPQLMGLIALMGLMDNWLDLRRRVDEKTV